jgi:hypothetical protein
LDTQQFLAAGILKLMNTGHQRFCRHFLFFGGFRVPGSAVKNFGTSVERSNVVLHRVGAFFANIQPSFAPPLDGVGEFDVKVFDIRANANNNTAYVVGDVVGAIAAEAEDALPQSPIRMDSEEALAESNENRDMEDGIGSQLMQLQPVNKEKTAEEIVNGGREAADKMVNKTDPILDRRRWIAFLAGEAQRVLLLHEPEFLHQVQVLVGDLGSLPLQIFRRHL